MAKLPTRLRVALLAILAVVPSVSAQVRQAPAGPLTMDNVILLGKDDLNDFWNQEFTSARWTNYRAPHTLNPYLIPRLTPCGPAVLGNAFYCTLDHNIYYDLSLMRTVFGTTKFGDFGALTVLAHEWSHAVQAQLPVGLVPVMPIFRELQADCMAGAYAQFLLAQRSTRLKLDKGDLEEGATLLFALGDTLPWFDQEAHGAPGDRSLSFVVGLAEGVTACFPGRRHRDSEGAFTISYPRSWKVFYDNRWSQDGQTYYKSFLMGPPRAERLELNGYMSEGIRIHLELPRRGNEWTPAHQTQWASIKVDEISRQNPNFRVTATQPIAFASFSGTLYRFEGTDARIREPERTSIVIIADRRFLMQIELSSPASAYDYYQFRLDQLLGTLQILNPVAPLSARRTSPLRVSPGRRPPAGA